MQNTNELAVQQILELDVQQLETADACAEQLKLAATEANKMAASAVAYGHMAIRYAIKSGEIMIRAKELLPHGEFLPWLAGILPAIDVSERTGQNWMKLAKTQKFADLLNNPNIKNISDAYRATGILPEPEPKAEGGEGAKDRPPFTLSFKTQYRLPSEWQRDAARDFLYEFERLAKLAMQLKTEFGL
jgi:hypothetical protein